MPGGDHKDIEKTITEALAARMEKKSFSCRCEVLEKRSKERSREKRI
jgi:hypothetical protein